MIYNYTDCGRTLLNLAVSNNGEHFRMIHVLEDQRGGSSYPARLLHLWVAGKN